MKNYKNAERFLQEGLFCEWAYILNLDTRKLEIYSGFHAPTGQGRYNQTKNECSKQYGGVALVCEVSFDTIRAMFSKPKYCALAAKFYGVVNAKAEMTKVNFQYFENLSYSEKDIEEYFAAIAKIDVAPLIVAQLQSGTKFTCNEKHFLKISDSKYAAVELNYFLLYEFSYFEGKSLFIS